MTAPCGISTPVKRQPALLQLEAGFSQRTWLIATAEADHFHDHVSRQRDRYGVELKSGSLLSVMQ
jgi:hypothetical protein